ncbi:MAG: J domain-containing protein [Boseongicola sp.]
MTPVEKAQAVAAAQETLGVAAHATEVELRSAWKKLAFEMHPDRGTGTSHELANINTAYNLLRIRSRQLYPDAKPGSSTTRKQPTPSTIVPKQVRPRPVVNAKITQLTELVTARCRKVLNDGAETQQDHVPEAIRRSGREVEYLVTSRLAQGVNRIALPICDYSGTRKSNTRTITFSASTSGSGTFTIPEQLRRDLFPGARDVRIHFAKTGV